MMQLVSCVRDQNLKLTLSFGIGLHHAGLHEKDREIAEELFVNQKIQVESPDIVLKSIFIHFSIFLLSNNY